MNFKSCLASISLLAVSFCAFAPSASAVTAAANQTFYFSGTCGDCAGTGYGTLILQNYTLGTALSAGNFVSFNYNSNLLPGYSFAGDAITYFGGSINAATASYNVTLFGHHTGAADDQFITSTYGNWCTGGSCDSDYGTNGIYSTANPATPPPSVTPEPATISLLGTGIAGIVALRRRRRS